MVEFEYIEAMNPLLLNISFDVDFMPLMVVMALAWLAPMVMSLFKNAKVPTVIIEIIVGYFIGRHLLIGASDESLIILNFLALSGFVFLMFLSGLEIDIDQIVSSFPRSRINLKRFVKNPLLVALFMFILTMALSYISALALGRFFEVNNYWYFSLIFVTSSIGVIMPVLKSNNELSDRFGQMIIVAAAVADILSIILFTFTAFIISKGFSIELLYIFGLFFAFYIAYRLARRIKDIKYIKKVALTLTHTALQLKIRGVFLLLLVFVVLAQYIDHEAVLLGAFLAGILVSIFMQKERSILVIKLDGIGYGFFLPIFFIMVGVNFDAQALAELDSNLYWFLGAILIVMYLVKVLPAMLWAFLFGTKRAISGGFLMSSRLSLIIAASKIGLDLGVITAGQNASFIIMAIITCFVSPLLYNLMTEKKMVASDKVVIIGGSSTGVLLARRLAMHGRNAIIVEKNQERFEEIRSKGINCIMGDGKISFLYKKLKLSPNNYVIVKTGTSEENVLVCEVIKDSFSHEKLISMSAKNVTAQKLRNLNVDMIDMRLNLATTIENLIFRPNTYQALVETFENFTVEEIIITNKEIEGKSIKEVPFHKNGSLILIRRENIEHDHEMIIPHGDTYFKLGDVVTVFGSDSAMQSFRETLI